MPSNMSEQEVVETITRVAQKLARKFRFGYHAYEDIVQEGILEGLKGLEKYDEGRPLENFMWTHIRNRLYNYKRDNYERPDKPCLKCPLYDPHFVKSKNQCAKFVNREDCEPYEAWYKRNSSKKNLMAPIGMSVVNDENEDNLKHEEGVLSLLDFEVLELIDREMPMELRKLWLQMKYGEKILKKYRVKVVEAIREILEVNDIDVKW